MRELYDVIARFARPGARIVVTVSPAPMTETFTAGDVLAANTYGKSTLRAAAEDSARPRANVDYYPSYDAVLTSHRSLAYNAGDDLHVLDSAVRAVIEHFLRTYGVTAPHEHPEFVELDYLSANPDVHRAVLDEQFASGYDHWLAHGRAEGRPLRAEDRPLSLRREVGP